MFGRAGKRVLRVLLSLLKGGQLVLLQSDHVKQSVDLCFLPEEQQISQFVRYNYLHRTRERLLVLKLLVQLAQTRLAVVLGSACSRSACMISMRRLHFAWRRDTGMVDVGEVVHE